MSEKGLVFEDIKVGDEIPPLEKKITQVGMVMYAAATWDFHRYHYDGEFVQKSGFPRPFLDGQELGAFIAQMLLEWAGHEAFIKKMGFRFREFAYPGDILTCKGRVSAKYTKEGENLVECEVWIENQRGQMVLSPASATLVIPPGR